MEHSYNMCRPFRIVTRSVYLEPATCFHGYLLLYSNCEYVCDGYFERPTLDVYGYYYRGSTVNNTSQSADQTLTVCVYVFVLVKTYFQ